MSKCEMCDVEHDGRYGNGRFCSKICSRRFSSKHVDRSKTKKVKCDECGIDIDVRFNLPANLCLCDVCRALRLAKRRGVNKPCKCCGAERILKDGEFIYTCKLPETCNNLRSLKLHDYFVKFELNLNAIGTKDVYIEIDKIKNTLKKDYFVDELSVIQIRDKYKFANHSNVLYIMKKLNIDRRSFSDATTLSFKNNKKTLNNRSNSMYKHGKFISWNGYIFHYRSSYELEFAQILDEQRIDYRYEIQHEGKPIVYFDSTRSKERVCYPDFYLIDTNTIVEIKSIYTLNVQEMKDKFKKYRELGYNAELWLEKQYIDIKTL